MSWTLKNSVNGHLAHAEPTCQSLHGDAFGSHSLNPARAVDPVGFQFFPGSASSTSAASTSGALLFAAGIAMAAIGSWLAKAFRTQSFGNRCRDMLLVPAGKISLQALLPVHLGELDSSQAGMLADAAQGIGPTGELPGDVLRKCSRRLELRSVPVGGISSVRQRLLYRVNQLLLHSYHFASNDGRGLFGGTPVIGTGGY